MWVPTHNSRRVCQEGFPLTEPSGLPRWYIALVVPLLFILNVDKLAVFTASLTVQAPRVLCGGIVTLSSSLASRPFVMSAYTFWPAFPNFTLEFLHYSQGECHLVLVICLYLVRQVGIKSLAHLLLLELVSLSCQSQKTAWKWEFQRIT